MDTLKHAYHKLSAWQAIFLQSKVNGAQYHGENLFPHKWDWPRDTYLQRPLRALKETYIRCRTRSDQNFLADDFESNTEGRSHLLAGPISARPPA
jgi:hypothetical protein